MSDELGCLLAVTSPRRLDETRFALTIPPGWEQGRGAFGGLVLGAMTRAIEAREDDRTRTLRSLTAAIVAPVVAGEATIEVEVFRRGNGVSAYTAKLSQGGDPLAQATGLLGKSRGMDRKWSPPTAFSSAWGDVPVLPLEATKAPTFTKFLEYRARNGMPGSGAATSNVEGWVRTRRALPALGSPEIVALADAWWPGALAMESAMRPMSTIAFTLQRFTPTRPAPLDSPCFHRAQSIAAEDGFVVEQRELWTEHGELLALNQQTFVMIR